MKDIFREYKTYKLLTHLGIIGASLMLALGINMYLGTTSSGQMLTTSVLDATTPDNQADFIASAENGMITFEHTDPLQDIVSITFSVAYNPSGIELGEPTSPNENEHILPSEESSGFVTYFVEYSEPMSSSTKTTIMLVPYTKNSAGSESLNITNAYVTDTAGETYFLSTQGVIL